MKGSISLNPKFTILLQKPLKIIKTSPLIATDQKNLYFKGLSKDDKIKSIKWENKDIVNCTYLKNYKIIIALCENYRLYVLTQNLQELDSMPGWQSKYSLAFQYIQQYGILLMIGPETVQMLRVSIQTNIKKIKFASSIKFTLKKLTVNPSMAKTSLSWNKGYNINIAQNLLYVWSPDSISFMSISSFCTASQSFCLTKKQNPLTFILFLASFKYTLSGLSCGEIKIWRLPTSSQFHHQNVLIHTFGFHSKSINNIVQSKNNQAMVYSIGDDMRVVVWMVDTFQVIRSFQFQGVYSHIKIISQTQAYAIKDTTFGIIDFGQSLSFITDIRSNIIMIDKQINPQNSSLTLTLDQNIGIIMKSDSILIGKDLNKIQIKYVYPPLKAKSIKQIISSPFVQNDYFLLAQNGQLFKVVVPQFNVTSTGVSSKIDKAYVVENIIDREKHALNQSAQLIVFLPFLLPEFDSQIRDVNDNQGKSYPSDRSGQARSLMMTPQQVMKNYKNLKLLAIGCSKGSIILSPSDTLTHIFSRLTYHRSPITHILPLLCHNQYSLISYCQQNYLKLISFDFKQQSASCLLTYYGGDTIRIMKSFQHVFVVVWEEDFQIGRVQKVGKRVEIMCGGSKVVQNHQHRLHSVSFQKQHQIILTAAYDNKIKLWTLNKILLYEIVMDDGLSCAFFLSHKPLSHPIIEQNKSISHIKQTKQIGKQNQYKKDSVQAKLKQLMSRPRPIAVSFDILILHSNKLLSFNHIPLSFRPNEIQQYNVDPTLNQNQKLTLKEIFEIHNQRKVDYQLDYKVQPVEKNFQVEFNLPRSGKAINRQRQRMKTQITYVRDRSKRFFTQESIQQSRLTKMQKKQSHIKTQQSIQRYIHRKSPIRQSSPRKSPKVLLSPFLPSRLPSYKQLISHSSLLPTASIIQTKKHLFQLSQLKKQIHANTILPPINKRNVVDQFVKDRFHRKTVMTRRDITLNRIIMKNIVKEHFQTERKDY